MSTTLFIGFKPIDESRFLISDGDSPTFILSITHPAYLGQAEVSLISSLISFLVENLNFLISGNLRSLLFTAFISLATPRWDAASALFGVSEMS